MVPIDDMDKFGQKAMKKMRPSGYWIDIPEPIRKGIAGSKNKIVSLCKTNTHLNKLCIGDERNVAKPKTQNIRNPFILKKKKKKLKTEWLEIFGQFLKQKKKKKKERN